MVEIPHTMVHTIIKRDGTKQPFSAQKLNAWGEWATKTLGNLVDWSSVVLETVRTCPEECSSVVLQERLIKTCLDRNTWSYNRMAGRLYVALLRKQIYPDGLPTVRELHDTLIAKGYMIDLGYSDEEYTEIEKLISHRKDFKASHSELSYTLSKYSLQDRISGRKFETQQFIYMRMAMALASDSKPENKMRDLEGWYRNFSEKKVNAPTPNFVNLGTPLKGFASCCLVASDDNAKSLAIGDHIAYTMTYMSAGIGTHLATRSLGDPVRGGMIQHQGKLPYYRSMVGAVKANLQAGRGGACTTHYNMFDPEVEVISRLKNPMSTEDKKIRGMDYSAGGNKLLARKAAKGEKVFTFNKFTAPDLYAALYSSDFELFESLYNKYEKDKSFTKQYVDARSILKTVLNEGFETGRAYLHWIDEMNRHTPFIDEIYSSNLCVAPETRILTKAGYIPISDVEDDTIDIWNGKEWSTVVVKKTGENQKLLKVTTNSGMELEATPYHKWYTVHRSGGGFSKIIEKRTHELKKGDKLIKSEFPIINGDLNLDRAYENGFFSGDGCESGGKQIIYLYHDKRNLQELFQDVKWYAQDEYKRLIGRTCGLENKFFVPLTEYTLESRVRWLEGVCDADGTVCLNGKTQSIQLGSINKEFLQDVQIMLQTMGINSKVTFNTKGGYRKMPLNDGSGENGDFWCQDSYRLMFGQTSINKLQSLGFSPKRLILSDHKPNRECSQFVKIESVEDEGRYDDTYCFNEPKRHMGVFNGLLTGQCQETILPSKPYQSMEDLYTTELHHRGEVAMCSLAGVNVDNINTDEEYYEAAYYALLMIDRCIHMSHYELPHIGATSKARLNAGVGIIGMAHYLAKNHAKYSEESGKRLIHELAERHAYFLTKASLDLGKELGNAPWINKTKWPEGWLFTDTYNKNVDGVVGSTLNYDWEALRKDIITNGGIRNSVLIAHMPSESSSKASGTTNGVYPIRDLSMLKGDATNITYWCAPDNDKLAKWYEKAWDVPTKDMIDVYAILQKFTDQGISADLYRKIIDDEKVGSKEMLSDYFYMTKMGMKTRYYVNSKTSAGVDLNETETGCAGGSCTL